MTSLAAPNPAEFLRVVGLHAFYGESHILHGVNLSVGTGELVTLLGRNGSGRTTTLKAILGLVDRRTGHVVVNGRETIAMPTHRIVHLGIGYCPEERGIFASLSAEENLTILPTVGSGGGIRPSPPTRCTPRARRGPSRPRRSSPRRARCRGRGR